jgi:cytochrome P450
VVFHIGGRSVRNVTDAVELVPLDEDSYYQDPLGFFARLRESRPVAPVRMPGYGRAWIVTRYDDVRAVLNDPRMAKDVHRWPGGGRSRPSEATGVYAHMLHADPPDHTRLRRPVQKLFASRRAALRPWAEEVAAGLLDEMEATRGDVIDLLDAYAQPLPITVICELLGVPVEDREWIRVIVYAYDERTEHARVERELAAYFTELIAAKRADPGDDLVSDLIIASDIAGADGLTGSELVSAAFLLVMAGFDTTVNLIASGILALLKHPEEMARLRQDPSLLRSRRSLLPRRSAGPDGGRGRPRCAACPLPANLTRGHSVGAALASRQPDERLAVPPRPTPLTSCSGICDDRRWQRAGADLSAVRSRCRHLRGTSVPRPAM